MAEAKTPVAEIVPVQDNGGAQAQELVSSAEIMEGPEAEPTVVNAPKPEPEPTIPEVLAAGSDQGVSEVAPPASEPVMEERRPRPKPSRSRIMEAQAQELVASAEIMEGPEAKSTVVNALKPEPEPSIPEVQPASIKRSVFETAPPASEPVTAETQATLCGDHPGPG